MKRYVEGDDRSQSTLFPERLDDYIELTCTSGAIGKCIRWGYRHWEEQSGGPPLRALH